MLLYLVRHGKAEPGLDDAARPLSDAGVQGVRRVAKALDRADVRVERVEHSELVRARQTAEILHDVVGGELVQAPGLLPDDDIVPTVRRLHSESAGSLMLVGHMPFMSRLASSLVADVPEAGLFHLRTGAMVCLAGEGGTWTVEWMVYPGVA